ncbi:acyltransferase domain-containing protein [Streptomyces armeniacus]|uniref:Acyltransferase domain-containing protein n=1 Tax=Streptomyces armeniacus TaxID=83291 RepID=A0A345XP01_9ACTN|nr:type I polyketide synthase [Streptomyces armeniacus]AXK33367.1 acyltransferase domain-containing protein [Streptomyces armeniacus]
MVKGNRSVQPPAAGAEPVAVIGLGCRFAGDVHSPEGFWELLLDGRDGIGEVPPERWEFYEAMGPDYAAALRRATRWGGYLSDIEGFDAEFFGLTPREAELMDPQQRILLEVTWEALEHAGIPPRELAGGGTGVFVGVGSDDYGRRMLEDLPRIEAWTGIGAAMCAVANRISYALDLRGPSLAVDTACSASLVAMHLACQSLRLEESSVAIAAGVNLIVSPGLTLTLDAAGAMAPDGRCKSFDASADGYGRGEGCGVLVLKRLADAERDGDRVLAVVSGSAVSQDGRTNGIMAPSGDAQQHVLERACRQAAVDPATVDYVEAHGTGTRLGDPLEASALSAVYGAGRDAGKPCLIGSVKSNIGHLEAAAGVASLIKAVLSLSNGEIPPTLNHTAGNPAVDWDTAGLRVVTDRTPWPRGERPRRAGVSGFGYGGTISHVLLEEAPAPAGGAAGTTAEDAAGDAAGRELAEAAAGAEAGEHGPAPRLFPLSAASEAALRQYAGDLAGWLTGLGSGASLDSVGHTLSQRRSHLPHRATVVASDRTELVAGLRRLAEGEAGPGLLTGTVPAATAQDAGLVWVFSGHGSQWTGMGRELLATEPAFASVIDSLEPVFLEEIGFSPRQVLADGDFEDVDRVQTMIFAMQLGLAEVWRARGVTPAAVIGHSVGEIAAAVTCGALTREEGARLICRRSVLLRRVAGKGAMAMASLSFADAQEKLAGRTDVVAAIASSPLSTVIAGDTAAVEKVIAQWKAEDIPMRRVASDVAFHSAHMDPLLAELSAAAGDLSPTGPVIPMYSTALEDPRATPTADGAYWAANLRNPVRLAAAVQAAAEDGYGAFLEVSAHPVVAHSVNETLPELGFDDAFTGSSLRRDQPERATLLAGAGALHCHGVPLDWARLHPRGDLVALPQVAWQRARHWRDAVPGGGGAGLRHDVDAHTLLGAESPVAGRQLRLWRTLLEDANRPYPGSHTINGVEIVPAAVLVNSFLSAASDGVRTPTLTDVSLRLPLTTAERREVQVLYDDAGARIASRVQEEDGPGAGTRQWLTHTTAHVAAGPAGAPPAALPEPDGAAEPADPGLVRRHLTSVGVPTMGFEWTVDELTRTGGGLRARVRTDQPEHAAPTWAPLLDAALSIAPAAYPGEAVLRMVAHVDEVHVAGEPPAEAVVDVALDPDEDDAVHVLIADAGGRVLARLAGLRYAGMDRDPSATATPEQLVHEMVWRPLDLAAADPEEAARRVVLVGADGDRTEELRALLAKAGADCAVVSGPEDLDAGAHFAAPADVLLLPAAEHGDGPVADAAVRSAWLLTRTAQRLAALDAAEPPRLWCVTSGVRESAHAAGLAQAPLWGLSRIVAGEHPELWGGLVDVPAGGPGTVAGTLLETLRAAPREDAVALRDGAAFTARLARPEGEPSGRPVECRADGTYLVTGGLGILGLEVARWLAERGARRLVLAGRRPFPVRADWDGRTDADVRRQIDGIRALEAAGVTVRTVALDVADAAEAARVLDPDALGLPPVRGVVHAAGVLDNRMLAGVDEASLRTVMRPKVAGAWTLHELFPPGSVDFLAFFSSCGQLLGLPGQASYGAANAFLDALAVHRRTAGHADTFSLGWTSWRGKGMAVNKVVDLELQARGVTDISVPEAFGAWDLAARHGAGSYAVLGLTALEPGGERLPLLSELSAGTEAGAAAGSPGAADELAGLAPEELRERLLEEVGGQIAAEMRLSAQRLDPRRSLAEQGLDSVMTVVIRRRLEKRFGQSLPATLLWHQPTVFAIAEHLAGLLSAADTEDTTATPDTAAADEPMPMVGA